MSRFWDRIRDWAVLALLLIVSFAFMLTANEPMFRGMRARSLEITGSVESMFTWLGQYVRAIEENEDLREANIQLSSDVARAREAIIENTRLRDLLSLRDSSGTSLVAARIISKDITNERNFIALDVGSNHGIEEEMAVIDSRGIIGKTVLVAPEYTRVMTYLNSDFFVPAKIQPSQSDGIVHWDGERHDRLIMEHVVRSEPVQSGQLVVTSGYSSVYSPGYAVGVIDSVFARPGLTTWQIYVRPLARIDNANHVFVVRFKPNPDVMDR